MLLFKTAQGKTMSQEKNPSHVPDKITATYMSSPIICTVLIQSDSGWDKLSFYKIGRCFYCPGWVWLPAGWMKFTLSLAPRSRQASLGTGATYGRHGNS